MCKSHRGNTTVSNFLSSIGNLPWFLAKKWVEILIIPSFQLKFDNITVALSLIVLSRIFYKLTLILSYSIPKFVKIECHLQG